MGNIRGLTCRCSTGSQWFNFWLQKYGSCRKFFPSREHVAMLRGLQVHFFVDKVEGGTDTKGHSHAHINHLCGSAGALGNGLAHTAPDRVLKSLGHGEGKSASPRWVTQFRTEMLGLCWGFGCSSSLNCSKDPRKKGPKFHHLHPAASYVIWAVFKIPLSVHSTGWLKSGFPRSWITIIPKLLGSTIPKLIINQPSFISYIHSYPHIIDG